MSPVVMEIGWFAEVDRLFPAATVTTPVPLAERVTPLAPDELTLKVMLPLLALVVRDKRPLAVMEPLTLIVWSLVRVKALPELVPGPTARAAPAPLLLRVTLPEVLAVRLVVEVERLTVPLVEVMERVPEVRVPAPVRAPEPLAVRVMVPAEAELVERLLATVIAPLLALVTSETE